MSIESNTHTDQQWRQVGAICLSEECQNFISVGATFSSKPADRLDAQGVHRRDRIMLLARRASACAGAPGRRPARCPGWPPAEPVPAVGPRGSKNAAHRGARFSDRFGLDVRGDHRRGG
ncbi:hypothetical protein D3C85_179190 [compost metagenome]